MDLQSVILTRSAFAMQITPAITRIVSLVPDFLQNPCCYRVICCVFKEQQRSAENNHKLISKPERTLIRILSIPRHMLRTLGKLIPVCFVLGASIELFMIKTGFYDIGGLEEGTQISCACVGIL